MRVVTLVENDSEKKDLKSAHGLSLYIEHNKKKILFDIGPGRQYIKNAKKLGIHLDEVDYCIISHGHFDHGKGLDAFLRINKKATVYVHKDAFGKKYKNVRGLYLPIGIKKPLFSKRIIEIEEDVRIENGIKLFSNVSYEPSIIGDISLLKKTSDGFRNDDFDDEIYLMLYGGKSKVLFSGCSHKGIENIIDTIEKNEKKPFTAIVGGFHFSHYDSGDLRQSIYLEKLAEKFVKKSGVSYHTGHCTGDEAYLEMKNIMKSALNRIKTGTEFRV